MKVFDLKKALNKIPDDAEVKTMEWWGKKELEPDDNVLRYDSEEKILYIDDGEAYHGELEKKLKNIFEL